LVGVVNFLDTRTTASRSIVNVCIFLTPLIPD
jgi:hypothetical protein